MSTKSRLEQLARVVGLIEAQQADHPGYADDIARDIVAAELKRLAEETERASQIERGLSAEWGRL